MNLQVGNVDLNVLLAMVRRRLWLAVAAGSFVLAVVASLAYFLPRVYMAGATLLIEGRELPSDLVRSSGTVSVETRLSAISQEVLSNARLEKLVKDFGLNQERSAKSLDELLNGVRKAISVDVTEGGREGAIAFSVSFSGGDPQKVMDVANALASFYVERNATMREQQASGATNVLQVEIEQMKKRLEEQERQIQQYKDRNLGELPEQLDANTKAADRIHDRLLALTDEIARKRDRRAALATQPTRGEAGPTNNASPLDALTNRVMDLRHQLAELQSRYSDKYPDVEQTKRELEALEERLRLRSRSRVVDENGERKVVVTTSGGPRGQVQEVDAEINRLEAERKKLQQQLTVYQGRIDKTPKRELELQALTRDYTALREKYASLVGRQEEARLAGRQKGEQFRVLDPATYPMYPLGPRRLRLLAAGLILSLGAALGSVIVWEKFIDTSFHSAAELESATKFPVLVTIPRMATVNTPQRRFRGQAVYVVSLLVMLCLVTGAVRHIATNNTQLAMKFSSKPVGTK